MRQYFIFLLLLQLFTAILGNCMFSQNQVSQETRIAAALRDGKYEILNRDTIAPGEIIFFICSESDIVRVSCDSNNQFSNGLPIKNCDNPPRVVIEEIDDNGCLVQTYRVGYKVGGSFLEIYRSCFDKSKLTTWNTTYTAYPNSIVTERPKRSFTTDGVMTGREATAYKDSEVRDRFKALLGQRQNKIPPANIHRGHLTPSGDYLFPENMRSTFKLINAIPQFMSINLGNWKKIENYVRDLTKSNGEVHIITGAFDVLILSNANNVPVKMYLLNNNRIPIPKWIYKIIRSASFGAVFLTSNNVWDRQLPLPTLQQVNCPIQLKNTTESGLTYCYDPNDFATNVIPHMQH